MARRVAFFENVAPANPRRALCSPSVCECSAVEFEVEGSWCREENILQGLGGLLSC